MATLDELLRAVFAADEGPEVCAAFDYDGTLISGYSAAAFYEHRIKHGDMGPIDLARTMLKAREGIGDEADFAVFLNMSLAAWEGKTDGEMEELGNRLFKHQIASKLHRETYAILEAHRQMGHTLVLASSALRFQTEPMARELGMDHCLHTDVELDDEGRLTGRALGTPLYGSEKAAGLQRVAEAEGLDLERSFAYSNGREDIPFLAAVGHPVAIEPDAELNETAGLRGWPVLRCEKPPGRPGLTEVARTVGFYGGFFSSVGSAVGVGLARRSLQAGIDHAIGSGADLSLGLAGVEVVVIEGQEHLWSHRPAVFVFNHTSKIDPFIVFKIVREGFTGVAKAEAKKVPIFGALFQIAGVAFIDRANNKRAVDALAPVVEKLRSGTSIVVSPEGTRSATPRLGPFKKGPFHIAMQAGVPIVPMCFKGVDGVQWRGAQALRAGRVEVVVLPPVDTSTWTAATVEEHRDEVRDMMAAALDNWPGRPGMRQLDAGASA